VKIENIGSDNIITSKVIIENPDEYEILFKKLGLESRLNKLKEELGECLVDICHFQDNKVKSGSVIEELGDIFILTHQIVDILDAEKEFQNCIDYKKVNFCDKFGAVDSE